MVLNQYYIYYHCYNNYPFFYNNFIMSRCIDLSSIETIVHLDPQSPLKDEQSLGLDQTPRQIAKHYSFNRDQYTPLINILQKQHNWRTYKELKQISEYIRKNSTLAELAQINGMQFCKGIMRSAIICQYKKGQFVEQKGSPLTKIYIILSGKIASIKNQDDTDLIQHMKKKQVYEILINLARKESKKIKPLKKFPILRERKSYSYELQKNYNQWQFLQTFEKDQIYGDKLLCFSKNTTHTLVTLQNSLLLTIDIQHLFHWLNASFQLKLQQTYDLLKQHPCFSYLQQQNLQQIIQILTIHKVKKNQIIYQQGSRSNHIYFLQTGQLTIEKQTKLFIDNPNNLYVDRHKLMSQRERKNKQYLPYANLSTLYNLIPMVKNIQIGTINPFCIFGEQDIFENKARDTTVRCKGINATYYGIQIKKISEILKDDMLKFVNIIKQSLIQKVKYRQNYYANTINIENKNNLKGFYYDNPTQKDKVRRNKIKKYNQIIQNNNKNNQQLIQPRRNINQKDENKINLLNIRYEQQQNVNKISPLYNNFNFHKMLNTKLNKTIHSERLAKDQSFRQSSKRHIQKQNSQQEEQQFRIIESSHTWRLVKQKVNQQQRISNRFGSLKHKIDVNTPLIDGKYFQSIESKIKSLERKKKRGRFSLSKHIIINKSTNLNNLFE